MKNSLGCLISVSALLSACSGGADPLQNTQGAFGSAGAGGLAPATEGNSDTLVVPMSMVIPKKMPMAPVMTAPAQQQPAAAGSGAGFPGAGSFPGAGPGASVPGAGAMMTPPTGGPATAGAAGSGPGTVMVEPSATGDRATPEGVCARWKADRADLSEGTWTGNAMSCDVGDMDPNARAAALRSLNVYRWLADLPTMTTDPQKDMDAQACALLQRANNSLSHTPPSSWMCYMDAGAKAAGRCNISSGPAVSSVDGYMLDPGNETTIGHRRWILSNSMGPTGIGGTDRHSCLMTTGNMRVGKAWQAWPAPGVIPIQAMQSGFGQWVQSIDSTGWTVQSDTVDLNSATVTVTSGGMALPVTVTQLMPGYGSRFAFRFNPMGWKTEAGKTYTVEVGGAPMPIKYDVQVVDCK
jgi:hypothetical protein